MLRIPSRDVEVVISDNDPTPRPELDNLSQLDSRVIVVRPPHELSMTANFDFCVRNCNADWVYLLGGDDGVAASRFDDFSRALDASTSGVVTGGGFGFFWPGVWSEQSGRLSWWLPRSTDVARLPTAGIVKYFGRHVDGRVRPSEGPPNLPMPYMFGAVRRDVLERVRRISGGSFFSTVTPDWWLSAAISVVCDHFEVMPLGIGIQGAAAESNGINSSRNWSAWNEAVPEWASTSALGRLDVYSLELLWMDVWLTLRGVTAVDDHAQRLRIANYLGGVTPPSHRDEVLAYLLRLWPSNADQLVTIYQGGYRGATLERFRRRLGPRRYALKKMLEGAVYYRFESPEIDGILAAADLIAELPDRKMRELSPTWRLRRSLLHETSLGMSVALPFLSPP